MAADDRGPELAAVTLLFLGLSTVTVTLRCYVRACLLKAFRLEDGLAIATMACFISYTVVVMTSIRYGAGKHIGDVPNEDIPELLKMRWAGELVYMVTSLFLKFTVGVFLLRICSQVWQRTVIDVVLLICLTYHIFYAFMAVFQCQPVEYFWVRYTGLMNGKCLSKQFIEALTYAATSINALSDWVLGLLPIALVWNLELNRRSKILVACILALGSVASSATFVRIPYIWQLNQDGDYTYQFTDIAIWSTVENGLGLTASSIATLRPLFRKALESMRGGTRSRQRWPSWRKSGSLVVIHSRKRSVDLYQYQYQDHRYPMKSAERVRLVREAYGFR
ncbi:hypothetical protein AAE478_003038 [Parahypoxylon ruwenzoriense]